MRGMTDTAKRGDDRTQGNSADPSLSSRETSVIAVGGSCLLANADKSSSNASINSCNVHPQSRGPQATSVSPCAHDMWNIRAQARLHAVVRLVRCIACMSRLCVPVCQEHLLSMPRTIHNPAAHLAKSTICVQFAETHNAALQYHICGLESASVAVLRNGKPATCPILWIFRMQARLCWPLAGSAN